MSGQSRENDRSDWYRRNDDDFYGHEFDDPIPEDPKKADQDAALGCGFVLTILFAVLSAIGFYQMDWPWAFGAIAGIVFGCLFTLFMLFFFKKIRDLR